MKLIGQITIALVLAGLASAQDVQYNFDRQTDFSRFKTYKWVEIPGGQKIDDLLAKDIQTAFDAALGKRALAKTESDPADLYVGYQVAVSQEKEITTQGSGWGYGPGWRRGPGFGTASTSTMLIGSVALDMYDVSKKRLIWRGIVTKAIDTHASPDTRRKNMAKAFDKLLKKYPPARSSAAGIN